jgi:hypothetical protein
MTADQAEAMGICNPLSMMLPLPDYDQNQLFAKASNSLANCEIAILGSTNVLVVERFDRRLACGQCNCTEIGRSLRKSPTNCHWVSRYSWPITYSP